MDKRLRYSSHRRFPSADVAYRTAMGSVNPGATDYELGPTRHGSGRPGGVVGTGVASGAHTIGARLGARQSCYIGSGPSGAGLPAISSVADGPVGSAFRPRPRLRLPEFDTMGAAVEACGPPAILGRVSRHVPGGMSRGGTPAGGVAADKGVPGSAFEPMVRELDIEAFRDHIADLHARLSNIMDEAAEIDDLLRGWSAYLTTAKRARAHAAGRSAGHVRHCTAYQFPMDPGSSGGGGFISNSRDPAVGRSEEPYCPIIDVSELPAASQPPPRISDRSNRSGPIRGDGSDIHGGAFQAKFINGAAGNFSFTQQQYSGSASTSGAVGGGTIGGAVSGGRGSQPEPTPTAGDGRSKSWRSSGAASRHGTSPSGNMFRWHLSQVQKLLDEPIPSDNAPPMPTEPGVPTGGSGTGVPVPGLRLNSGPSGTGVGLGSSARLCTGGLPPLQYPQGPNSQTEEPNSVHATAGSGELHSEESDRPEWYANTQHNMDENCGPINNVTNDPLDPKTHSADSLDTRQNTSPAAAGIMNRIGDPTLAESRISSMSEISIEQRSNLFPRQARPAKVPTLEINHTKPSLWLTGVQTQGDVYIPET